MKTIMTVLVSILIASTYSTPTNYFPSNEVLVNGSEKTSFDKVAMTTSKPKMLVFYSSKYCAPCLALAKEFKAEIYNLHNNYDVLFVDSWTLGKNSRNRRIEESIAFYNANLKTENTTLLLGPNDELLSRYHNKKTNGGAVPLVVVLSNTGKEQFHRLGSFNVHKELFNRSLSMIVSN